MKTFVLILSFIAKQNICSIDRDIEIDYTTGKLNKGREK